MKSAKDSSVLARTTQPVRGYSLRDKYAIVADMLSACEGTVLDVGARDQRLRDHLDSRRIVYRSADSGGGHDYQLDLELPLPLPDAAFDYVIALDVLEHVEQIHRAFRELARITRKGLIIALPNMATLGKRWAFLRYGNLGTKKYDLLLEHQGDRHRWLTTYPQVNGFVAANAARAGLHIQEIVEELEYRGVVGRVAHWAVALGLPSYGLLTARCIYLVVRKQSLC